MKTLAYKTVFCCKGQFYNDGFIVAQIKDDGELQNMEGILTNDYLKAELIEKGKKIRFTIYSKNYTTGNMEESIIIDGNYEEFELPFHLNSEITEELIIEIKTVERIYPSNKYIKRLETFKKNNVFGKERN